MSNSRRFPASSSSGPTPRPAPMAACACTGLDFSHVACRMRQEALTRREAVKRSGCGGVCSACLPDLEDYLAATAPEACAAPKGDAP